jgi:hypothetical protein
LEVEIPDKVHSRLKEYRSDRSPMTEVGIAEYFSMTDAWNNCLFVILYFSRKQMHDLSVDKEQKSLTN